MICFFLFVLFFVCVNILVQLQFKSKPEHPYTETHTLPYSEEHKYNFFLSLHDFPVLFSFFYFGPFS